MQIVNLSNEIEDLFSQYLKKVAHDLISSEVIAEFSVKQLLSEISGEEKILCSNKFLEMIEKGFSRLRNQIAALQSDQKLIGSVFVDGETNFYKLVQNAKEKYSFSIDMGNLDPALFLVGDEVFNFYIFESLFAFFEKEKNELISVEQEINNEHGIINFILCEGEESFLHKEGMFSLEAMRIKFLMSRKVPPCIRIQKEIGGGTVCYTIIFKIKR